MAESHLTDSDLFFICTDVEMLQRWIPECSAKNANEIMEYRESLTIETLTDDIDAPDMREWENENHFYWITCNRVNVPNRLTQLSQKE